MKKSLLFGSALLWGLCAFGQSTVVSWSFDDVSTGTSMLTADAFNANNAAAQFQFTSNLTHWPENNLGQDYSTNPNDKALVLDNWGFDAKRSWMISVNTTGRSGLTFNFSMFCPRNLPAPAAWLVQYKVGDGSWGSLGALQMSASLWKELAYQLPSTCDNQELVSIRVMPAGAQVPFSVAMPMPVLPTSRVKIDNVSLIASVSTSLDEALSQDDVVIYPVPVRDIVNIQLPVSVQGEKVEVYSVVGNVVYQQAICGRGQCQVDLKSLSTGNYILKVLTDSGTVVKKIQVK